MADTIRKNKMLEHGVGQFFKVSTSYENILTLDYCIEIYFCLNSKD